MKSLLRTPCTMTLGCVFQYLHVGVNTSVCMADHFAVAFNIDPAELSLCNKK